MTRSGWRRIGWIVSFAGAAAALALGVLCLAAAVAAQGGQYSQRLDLLADLAPLWLLGALSVAAYGLLPAPRSLRVAVGMVGSGRCVRLDRSDAPDLDARSGPFSIVAVHLAHPTDKSQMQRALALAAVLDRYDHRRLIVAGDFHLAAWSFGLHKLDGRLGLERRDRALFSWPAYRSRIPLVPVDHVYAGQSWRTVSIERGPSLGSDHYPVVATLVLKK